MVEHQIICDHETNRSRGFGFVIFDSDEVVDELLSNGKMIDMAGTQVRLVAWSPKKNHVNKYMFLRAFASHSIQYIFKGCGFLLGFVFSMFTSMLNHT